MDEEQKTKLMSGCRCGSGKKYGECCGKSEMCFCGSGNKCSECCMAKPDHNEAVSKE